MSGFQHLHEQLEELGAAGAALWDRLAPLAERRAKAGRWLKIRMAAAAALRRWAHRLDGWAD